MSNQDFTDCYQDALQQIWAKEQLCQNLAKAVSASDIQTAAQLLNKGANPNAFDGIGGIVLKHAIYLFKTDMIKLLLDCPTIDVMATGTNTICPLHSALQMCSAQGSASVSLLLNHKKKSSFEWSGAKQVSAEKTCYLSLLPKDLMNELELYVKGKYRISDQQAIAIAQEFGEAKKQLIINELKKRG